MADKSVWVNVGRDKRDVLLELQIVGYTDLNEARQALKAYLEGDGPDGVGGKVLNVELNDNGLSVETDLCGFGFDNATIQKAVKTGRVLKL